MRISILKSFGKDALLYLPGQIFIGLSGFFSIIIYTRLFTAKDFGDYSLISGIIGVLITVLTGWLSQSTLRYYDDYKDKKVFITTIIKSYTVINVLVLLFGFITVQYLIKEIEPLYTKLVLIGIFLFSVQSFYTILKSILRNERKTKIISLNDFVVSSCQVFLVYLLVYYFSLSVESIIISLVVGYTISIVISIKHLKVYRFFEMGNFDFNIMKELFRYGFPLIGITFTSWILTVSDRYIIKIFGSSSEVGLYTINYSISYNIFNLFITFLMLAAFPLIIKTWNNAGKKETELIVSDMIKYFLVLTIPAFFGILILSKDIMLVFTTDEYASGHPIIPIIALGMIFLGVSQYINKIWELKKNTKIILYLNIVIAIVNFTLNILLIPKFGYISAALTTTISYFLYLILTILISNKSFNIRINLFSLINIIFPSIIMVVTIKQFKISTFTPIISLISNILIGAIVFLLLWGILEKIRLSVLKSNRFTQLWR